jgi:hypothetical protein
VIKVESQEIDIDIQAPFKSFGQTLSKRQSLIWKVSDQQHTIQSEQCFYPGLIPNLSPIEKQQLQNYLSTLPLLLEQLDRIQTLEQSFHLPWMRQLETILKPHHLFSPQFIALHWAWIKTKNQILAPLFQSQEVALSGLITQLKEDLDLNTLTTWKIKIARESFEKETHLIAQLIKKYPNYHFRLDANDHLSTKSLSQWIDWCQPHLKNIEYIESPCRDFQEWNELIKLKGSTLPLAFDLREVDDINKISLWSNLSACIVKPSLLSLKGVSTVAQYINQKHLPVQFILSSCFETPMGLNQIARMSFYCKPCTKLHHGLATAAWVDSNAKVTSSLRLGQID